MTMRNLKSNVLVLTYFEFENIADRDDFISRATIASNMFFNIEPGVTKCAVCIPWKGNSNTVVLIMEFFDESAITFEYMERKEYIDVMEAPYQLGPETWVRGYTMIPNLSKASGGTAPDAVVAISEITYTSAEDIEIDLPRWSAVRKASEEDEEGTLSYAVVRMTRTSDDPFVRIHRKVAVVESYTSMSALMDVHAISPAIKELANGGEQTVQLSIFSQVGGYMYKPDPEP